MKHDKYVSKLRDLALWMDDLASEDRGLVNQIEGFEDMPEKIAAYINRLEYNTAMESFSELPPELKETFLVQARHIYEGEKK